MAEVRTVDVQNSEVEDWMGEEWSQWGWGRVCWILTVKKEKVLNSNQVETMDVYQQPAACKSRGRGRQMSKDTWKGPEKS